MRVCLACGREVDRIERNHLAGRIASKPRSDLTVPLCVPCHRVYSHWQNERRADPPLPVLLETVAGTCDLLRLLARRDPSGMLIDQVEDFVPAVRAVLGLPAPVPSAVDEPDCGHIEPDPFTDYQRFLDGLAFARDLAAATEFAGTRFIDALAAADEARLFAATTRRRVGHVHLLATAAVSHLSRHPGDAMTTVALFRDAYAQCCRYLEACRASDR